MAKIIMLIKLSNHLFPYQNSNFKTNFYRICFLFLLHCFAATNCCSQTKSFSDHNHKGAEIFSSQLEYVSTLDNDKDVSVYTIKIGYGAYILKKLTLIGLIDLVTFKGDYMIQLNSKQNIFNADTFGIGTAMQLRWYVLTLGRISIFLDATAGFLYSLKSFPPTGTKLNFTARPGAGIAITVNKSLQLLIGANRFHLSNGQGYKHPINPSYDGLGIYLGMIFHPIKK
ncbi:acyloxyacyl hydrolase [Maribacter sp. CXY002]|uniref:acyloxyacyl hydrolase n=1 Tax=Maribacter luteocoastalis TaxID=3407671 RepID=UPI003B6846F3